MISIRQPVHSNCLCLCVYDSYQPEIGKEQGSYVLLVSRLSEKIFCVSSCDGGTMEPHHLEYLGNLCHCDRVQKSESNRTTDKVFCFLSCNRETIDPHLSVERG